MFCFKFPSRGLATTPDYKPIETNDCLSLSNEKEIDREESRIVGTGVYEFID